MMFQQLTSGHTEKCIDSEGRLLYAINSLKAQTNLVLFGCRLCLHINSLISFSVYEINALHLFHTLKLVAF